MRTLTAALLLSAALARADEPVDLDMVGRIRDEAYRNPKVMETAGYLTDVIGPRLTGSPAAKRANEWTRARLAGWGLSARVEPWGAFGRGWTLEHASLHMVQPVTTPLVAWPKAWSSATAGPVRGSVVRVPLDTEADRAAQAGKLQGRVVLLSPPRAVETPAKPAFERHSAEALVDLGRYVTEGNRPFMTRDEVRKRWKKARDIRAFLAREGALAALDPSGYDAGIISAGRGGTYRVGDEPGVPQLVVAVEDYNRLCRLLDLKQEVTVEVDVRAAFHDDDPQAYNTVAEIAGTDRAAEVVMAGAHLDSWQVGTGATDNAAGVAVVMEAVRILKVLGVKPRRTVRVALWTGEEEGSLGSRAWVREHLATFPEPDATDLEYPRGLWRPRPPIAQKPEAARLSAYFNMDGGTGAIRGLFAEENPAAAAVFRAWLAPLADLGVAVVTNRKSTNTDHVSFKEAGLPGYDFLQDPADYDTRTHHSSADVFDRLQRDDLQQASAVLATVLYHAAMRDGLLPRSPVVVRESESAF